MLERDHRIRRNHLPRMSLFSPDEIALVDEVIAMLRDLSAVRVSDLSHREAGWQLVEVGETIPYELAFVLAPDLAEATPAIRKEGRRILEQYADRLA